jgi:hypothetical protein
MGIPEVRYLRREEVSRITGYTVATLATWACRGAGPPFFRPRHHGPPLYREDLLRLWIERREGTTPSPQRFESLARARQRKAELRAAARGKG